MSVGKKNDEQGIKHVVYFVVPSDITEVGNTPQERTFWPYFKKFLSRAGRISFLFAHSTNRYKTKSGERLFCFVAYLIPKQIEKLLRMKKVKTVERIV